MTNSESANGMSKIVWNGCDSYIEADDAVRGYDFDGQRLHTRCESYEAFDVSEIDPNHIPKDQDGEMVLDGIFVTEAGKFYKRPN